MLTMARGVLEPLVAGHAGEMFRVLSDPAIYAYENEPPASEQWLAARYAALEKRGPGGDSGDGGGSVGIARGLAPPTLRGRAAGGLDSGGGSGGGGELWLNWVVRLGDGSAAGFVQATVIEGGEAYVAFVLNSAYWGRGLGGEATAAVLDELRDRYGVCEAVAVLKTANTRSARMLAKLGFVPAEAGKAKAYPPEADERVMTLRLMGDGTEG